MDSGALCGATPRILIVGTVPYNRQSTSRAFDSYFHNWPRECMAQVFSNTKMPCKGHCSTLYQITDQRMLKRRFRRGMQTGKIYQYDELPDAWESGDLEVNSSFISKLYSIGSHKNSLVYLLRKLLWKKQYWCTEEFDTWLDSFRPDCVFLAFSDDFFIPQIAMYVADRFQIPIISCIGDDYYFNYKKSISPLYHIYKRKYRKLIRQVFSYRGSGIYISDKIRDLYNNQFGLNGSTVYLTSEVKRRPFSYIPQKDPMICYFGNIRLGRNDALNEIASALGQIDPAFKLRVYSNENEKRIYKKLLNNPNVEYCGRIPYHEVMSRMERCDIQIVVEGFEKKDVDITRYSLSTKVADSIASGSAIFAYGSPECGAIEYAQSTGCIVTCTERDGLRDALSRLIYDKEQQKENYEKAIQVTARNHTLENSTEVFRKVVRQVLGEEN